MNMIRKFKKNWKICPELKLDLVDISLLSNCNNFNKPKDLKTKCIQKILDPHVIPKAWIKCVN